jgi:hypothetical protein
MNVYIWEDVAGLSTAWHDGGGAVVIAESLPEALRLLAEACGPDPTWPAGPHNSGSNPVPLGDPVVLALRDEVTPRAFRFLDAGCC